MHKIGYNSLNADQIYPKTDTFRPPICVPNFNKIGSYTSYSDFCRVQKEEKEEKTNMYTHAQHTLNRYMGENVLVSS